MDERLKDAIEENDPDEVRRVLANNPDFSGSTFFGQQNCLHLACIQKNADTLELLLIALGSDAWLLATARNTLGQTPLHVASAAGNSRCLFMLKKHSLPSVLKAAMKLADYEGNTPLHLAVPHDSPLLIGHLQSILGDKMPAELHKKRLDGKTPIDLIPDDAQTRHQLMTIATGLKSTSVPNLQTPENAAKAILRHYQSR